VFLYIATVAESVLLTVFHASPRIKPETTVDFFPIYIHCIIVLDLVYTYKQL